MSRPAHKRRYIINLILIDGLQSNDLVLNVLCKLFVELLVYLGVSCLKIELLVLDKSRPVRNVFILTGTDENGVLEPLKLSSFGELVEVSLL